MCVENFMENQWEMLGDSSNMWADSLPDVLNQFSSIFRKISEISTVSDTIYSFKNYDRDVEM